MSFNRNIGIIFYFYRALGLDLEIICAYVSKCLQSELKTDKLKESEDSVFTECLEPIRFICGTHDVMNQIDLIGSLLDGKCPETSWVRKSCPSIWPATRSLRYSAETNRSLGIQGWVVPTFVEFLAYPICFVTIRLTLFISQILGLACMY